MPQRGRARIAGSAIVTRFGQFADCLASAGVPCHDGLEFLSPHLAAIDIGELDDRPLKIRFTKARKPLIDPGRIENRQVKSERCANPLTEMRVIGEIIVRKRMQERR